MRFKDMDEMSLREVDDLELRSWNHKEEFHCFKKLMTYLGTIQNLSKVEINREHNRKWVMQFNVSSYE